MTDADQLLPLVYDELRRVAAAELARLRLFAGRSIVEAADTFSVSRATAFRNWSYARAWLTTALQN